MKRKREEERAVSGETNTACVFTYVESLYTHTGYEKIRGLFAVCVGGQWEVWGGK